MTFPTRWQITGTLTTRLPLHIGAGESREETVNKELVKVSAVARCGNETPLLPGSTLRGNVRSWLTRREADKKRMAMVFGTEAPLGGSEDAVGGKIEFWDAPLSDFQQGAQPHIPYFNTDRQTGIATSVVLNRTTGTAQEKLLAHQEFVPAGATFRVTITGQGLDETELALVLAGLEGFNDGEEPVTLGSDTGRGWGRLTWKPERIAKFDADALAEWIKTGKNTMWHEGMQALPLSEVNQLIADSRADLAGCADAVLLLDMRIIFTGQFLINDPSRKSTNNPIQPLLSDDGKAALTPKSLHGALRSQAERIVRTLGDLGGSACRPDLGTGKACAPIYKGDKAGSLCPVCQVFGATGWKSPIEWKEVKLAPASEQGPYQEIRQEYVAIDRFTGGSADKAKFSSIAAWRPAYDVRIGFDLGRLSPSGLGLLALVFRDLAQGDIPLGFMKRSFGSCRAEIRRIQVPATNLENLSEWKALMDKTPFAGRVLDFTYSPPDTTAKAMISALVGAFHDTLVS